MMTCLFCQKAVILKLSVEGENIEEMPSFLKDKRTDIGEPQKSCHPPNLVAFTHKILRGS